MSVVESARNSRSSRIPNTRLKRLLAVILVTLKRSKSAGAFYLNFINRLLDGILALVLRHKPAFAMAAAAFTVNLPPLIFAASVPFGGQQVISLAVDRASSVFAGDGDIDALSASIDDDRIAWYENTNGDGTSWTARTITTGADGAHSVFAAAVDGDGDTDALSASRIDDKIAWYENANGDGTSWTERTITTGADGAHSVFAADVDGDGDTDALSASKFEDKIAWYENTNGDGTAWTVRTISSGADGAYAVFAADVDGDGDIDALSASNFDDKIAWYENTNGDGTAWTVRTITTGADGAFSVFAADVDGDGDLDVLSASYIDDRIAWYENRGGQFALTTTDTAPSAIEQDAIDDVLKRFLDVFSGTLRRGCLVCQRRSIAW